MIGWVTHLPSHPTTVCSRTGPSIGSHICPPSHTLTHPAIHKATHPPSTHSFTSPSQPANQPASQPASQPATRLPVCPPTYRQPTLHRHTHTPVYYSRSREACTSHAKSVNCDGLQRSPPSHPATQPPTHLGIHSPTHSHTHPATQVSSHASTIHQPTHPPSHLPTHPPARPRTQPPTDPASHPPHRPTRPHTDTRISCCRPAGQKSCSAFILCAGCHECCSPTVSRWVDGWLGEWLGWWPGRTRSGCTLAVSGCVGG